MANNFISKTEFKVNEGYSSFTMIKSAYAPLLKKVLVLGAVVGAAMLTACGSNASATSTPSNTPTGIEWNVDDQSSRQDLTDSEIGKIVDHDEDHHNSDDMYTSAEENNNDDNKQAEAQLNLDDYWRVDENGYNTFYLGEYAEDLGYEIEGNEYIKVYNKEDGGGYIAIDGACGCVDYTNSDSDKCFHFGTKTGAKTDSSESVFTVLDTPTEHGFCSTSDIQSYISILDYFIKNTPKGWENSDRILKELNQLYE